MRYYIQQNEPGTFCHHGEQGSSQRLEGRVKRAKSQMEEVSLGYRKVNLRISNCAGRKHISILNLEV